jgi:hypothetical protein
MAARAKTNMNWLLVGAGDIARKRAADAACRKPKITLAEAAKTNRLLDAVYRSSCEKREVEV